MLELYATSLLINQEGGEECIDLMANGLWEIQDIPDWISASPTSVSYTHLDVYKRQMNMSYFIMKE